MGLRFCLAQHNPRVRRARPSEFNNSSGGRAIVARSMFVGTIRIIASARKLGDRLRGTKESKYVPSWNSIRCDGPGAGHCRTLNQLGLFPASNWAHESEHSSRTIRRAQSRRTRRAGTARSRPGTHRPNTGARFDRNRPHRLGDGRGVCVAEKTAGSSGGLNRIRRITCWKASTWSQLKLRGGAWDKSAILPGTRRRAIQRFFWCD